MPMHTYYENVKAATGSLPAVATATVTGAEMDAQGFGINAFTMYIGDSGDTLSGTVLWTLTIEESDTAGSGHTTVAAADIKGIVDHTAATVTTGVNSVVMALPAEDSRFITFEYGGEKRYLRAVVTATGTHTNGTPIAISNIQSRAATSPVVG